MRTLLIIRGLATIAVVLAHAIGWVYPGQSWWLDRYGTTVSVGFVDQECGVCLNWWGRQAAPGFIV